MAGDIERELAHAKAMATATHRPDCQHPTRHGPRPGCRGCVTDADRRLWAQLAAEYQAQLDRHRQETLL